MSVREAQARIDSHEFSEWMAYYHIDPFGWERFDFGLGQLCAVIGNLFRSKKDRKLTPQDFMHFSDNDSEDEPRRTPRRQTLQQMKFHLLSYAKAQNKSADPKKLKRSATKRLDDGGTNSIIGD